MFFVLSQSLDIPIYSMLDISKDIIIIFEAHVLIFLLH